MSGFAGIVHAEGATPDAKLLERLAACLAFRGHDATQLWSNPGAGFCFTLLRTGPAPQASAQPCSFDGNVWLMGDVRLDEREDLLARLRNDGAEAAADTTNEELVLRAWLEWGEKSFEYLVGDFSFAIWNAQGKKLWCARDLMGARPFFYSHYGAQFVFSNTLDAVRLAPEASSRLDPLFIADFLLQSWCYDPERSAFRDVRRLPAGHLLTFADGKAHVRRFAKLPVEDPLILKRPEEYLEQFREHFERAVRDRLPQNSAGVFMSGGLDSTSVAAVANKLQTARRSPYSLRAYTVDYTPLIDDEEGQFASAAAQHIGIPISLMDGSSTLPFARWDELSLRTPEPCAEPFFALHVQHYRELAAHARVALTGDGGDDVMTGRAWPHLVYLLRRDGIAAILKIFGGYALRHARLPPLRVGLRTRLRRWMGHREELLEFPPWLEPSFEKEFCLRDRWRQLQEPRKPEHPLHPSGYASLTSPFWPSIYENEDAGWTGAAVETRAPLLDRRLLAFLLRLPPVPWCMDKAILRNAMKGLLPETVRLRRKTPLRGDPLLAHNAKNHWKPLLTAGACERLSMFVNCRMLSATSYPAPGLSLWNEIRPIALDIWLKTVENKDGIQYSRNEGN